MLVVRAITVLPISFLAGLGVGYAFFHRPVLDKDHHHPHRTCMRAAHLHPTRKRSASSLPLCAKGDRLIVSVSSTSPSRPSRLRTFDGCCWMSEPSRR